MNSVSVTIITKDEARNLEDCLRSVEWAHEVVIIDQFSEDGTPEIASRFDAKVFQEDWKGFARQKNSAIEKATGEWILSLDADERIPLQLRKEIEELIHQEKALDGYYIARKNFFCGQWIRHGGWYPDYSLRLFRRGVGIFEERAVHEKVVLRGKAGHLKSPLEHYTYRTIGDYLNRMDRYSRLASREVVDRGRCFHWNALLFRPLYTFFSMYFLRAGWMDGSKGLFLATSYAYYTFLKYYRFHVKDF